MNLKLAIRNAIMAIVTLLAAGLAMLYGDAGFGEVPPAIIYGIIGIAVVMAIIFWCLTARIDKINAANRAKKSKKRKKR